MTEHPATRKAPAELLMGRNLRTTLDIVKSLKNRIGNKYLEQMKSNYDKRVKERTFEVGQQVYLRNYQSNQDKWVPGIVTERCGSNTYRVHFGTGSRLAHADQLKKRVIYWEEEEEAGTEMEKRAKRSSPRGQSGEQLPQGGGGVEQRSTRKRKMTEKMRGYVENQFGKRRRREIKISAVILDMTQPDHYKSKRRSEEGSIDDELSTTGSLDAADALVPDNDSNRSPLEWTSSSHHRLGGGERNTTSRFPASGNVACGNRPSGRKGKTTLYGCRQQGKTGEAASGAPGILEKTTTTTAIICHGANYAEPPSTPATAVNHGIPTRTPDMDERADNTRAMEV